MADQITSDKQRELVLIIKEGGVNQASITITIEPGVSLETAITALVDQLKSN